jgi:hypothetical protein
MSLLRRSRRAVLLLATAALPLGAQTAPEGRWSLERIASRDRVQLTFRNLAEDEHRNSMTSFDLAPSELAGLSMPAVDGEGGDATFRLVRDAGTITFTGRVGHGLGIGRYRFAPNATFLADLARRGYGTATDAEAMQLTFGDISGAYLARLDELKYQRPTMRELVRLGTHGVSMDYLNRMAALGFNAGSAGELTRLRDHGVTPEYVTELRKAGYTTLEPAEFVRARDHGVDAELVQGFRNVGYDRLPMQTLIRMRDHGVTPEYATAIRRDGTQPTPEELVRLRDRGER